MRCSFYDDIWNSSFYPGGSKYMLFDKAPCNGPSRSYHRGLQSNFLYPMWLEDLIIYIWWNNNCPVMKVLQEEGFSLLGMATNLLTFHQAEEFLEVYRLLIAQFWERNLNISPEELLTNGVKVWRISAVVHVWLFRFQLQLNHKSEHLFNTSLGVRVILWRDSESCVAPQILLLPSWSDQNLSEPGLKMEKNTSCHEIQFISGSERA